MKINSTIEQVKDVGSPINIKLIGYYSEFNINSKVHEVTYQLEFNNIWLGYTSTVSKIDNRYFLTEIDYRELSDSLWKTNKFTLQNKGLLHYIILFFTIIIMLFTFVTSAISFGSGNKIGIPSYSVERECTYMPIILTLRFPIFAILYWIKVRNIILDR